MSRSSGEFEVNHGAAGFLAYIDKEDNSNRADNKTQVGTSEQIKKSGKAKKIAYNVLSVVVTPIGIGRLAKFGIRYVALGSSFRFNSNDWNKEIKKDLKNNNSSLSKIIKFDNKIQKLTIANENLNTLINDIKSQLPIKKKQIDLLLKENEKLIGKLRNLSGDEANKLLIIKLQNDEDITRLEEEIDGAPSDIEKYENTIENNKGEIGQVLFNKLKLINEDENTSKLQIKYAIQSSQMKPTQSTSLNNSVPTTSKLNYPEIKNSAGNKLDTVEILNPNHENTHPKDQKWVVYLPSKDDIYQNVQDDLQRASHNTGANILTGNYRGVLNSEGKAQSTKDLVDDARAMIQSLKDKGVPEENIVVQGWSFGGIIGAKAISSFNEGEEKAKMKFIGDRTPSSFGAVVKSFIKIPGPGKLTNAIFKAIGFDTKSADDVKAMDHNNVAFLMGVKDGVVPKNAHVHAKVSSSSDIAYTTQEFKDVGHTESSLYASKEYAGLIKNLLNIQDSA